MRRNNILRSVLLGSFGLLIGYSHLVADELGREAYRSGLLPKSMDVNGSVNVTSQFSNQKNLQNEVLSSFNLLASMPMVGGKLNFFIEGNTSPSENGVAQTLQGSNADAGTAVNSKGQGRIQLSEFNYARSLKNSQLAIGLINPASFLDVSDIANDENIQFLSKQLINNASIALPDYTLAFALHHEPEKVLPGYTLFISSSHGLADTEDGSYVSLFEVTNKNKGVFSAVEFYQSYQVMRPRIGVWLKNVEQYRKYGSYITVDGRINKLLWNTRFGIATSSASVLASEVGRAASLVVEYPVLNSQAGAGVAYLKASDKNVVSNVASSAENNANSLQSEVYVRMRLNKRLHMTPSLQYFNNSVVNGNTSGENALVANLRFGYEV
ncbi:MAG: hypothetical protein OEX07_11735 [Gammaproteobacteria bacterium]|nr:hypothetical protein [Gammaproteobacteria bacterium]